MRERLLTCIICPKGCRMTVKLSDKNEVVEICGNSCPRGIAYADSECTHPVRSITSTVICEDGAIVSVKTDAPVPKDLIFRVMQEINSVIAPSGTKIYDVIIKNVADCGVNVIATSNA